MSEVKGRAQARTDEPQDAEERDASASDAPAGGEPGAAERPETEDARRAEDERAETEEPKDGVSEREDGAEEATAGDTDGATADPGSEAADATAADSGSDDTSSEDPKSRFAHPDPIKLKIPAAQEITRTDFTPHALGAKGRGAPRSGTRAQAKRRRIVFTTAAVVVVALATSAAVWYETLPPPSVKVKGAFGKAPSISVPKSKPSVKRQVKEVVQGSGNAVANGDLVVAQLVAYKWGAKGGGKELLNTYTKKQPIIGQAGQLTGLPALDKALVGRKAGTRLVMTLPYGEVGDQIGQSLQLAKTDDFVVTVDVINAYGKTASAQGTPQKVDDPKLPAVTGAAGVAPTVKIPSTDAPDTLQVKTLIQGNGPVVTKGQTLIAQYHGVLWRNGTVFDSSWKRGTPASFPIGVKQVIPGWDTGLVGLKAGSRVLLVVPPKDGYGSKGSSQGGIKGTDTLVFVVDVLGSY
ncbi:FKBP-type peptidyl-prolyl cis-trans isomerase [Actinoallomurus purpureus]|uniref:FKBP-type peptidyl-prolyl cis-trans isomerase n=1 Tax=Actinoallomurus purpureus TaxID=478114 RepID=UPI002093B407|nr:FKBP-type peptidyl-prolyl cis-trans isomerase [Actinoallomurus purpureus]MCO6007768.1 FKBP-type peptidyl-prolyl cis-trans isomerase [Actinoallomurus purpureus]